MGSIPLQVTSALALLSIAFACLGAEGATRQAVLIGINIYEPIEAQRAQLERRPVANTYKRKAVPGGWKSIPYKNLRGAVADAELMKDILQPMGFTDIVTLYNQEATADTILSTLERSLIKEANAGDIRFVFYSGHGGYAKNIATGDQDETIVPADHWRDVPDIRDKELSRILYAAGSKGVLVTMVADSCHSGSLARGVWNQVGVSKTATAPFQPIEVNDPPDLDQKTGKPIDPKDKGVLYFAAAQRYEEAMEYETEEGAHGAFTWALRQALVQGPRQRMDVILQRTLSYLKAEARAQIPQLDATAERRSKGLTGEAVDAVQGLLLTADGVVDGKVTLRGGTAIGVYPGSELTRLDEKKPPVRLRVTRSLSAATSEAVIVEPLTADVSRADQFRLDKYVVPPSAMLRVFIPKPAPPSVIMALTAEVTKITGGGQVKSVEDRTLSRPTHVISWDGSGWILEGYPATTAPRRLGMDPKAVDIRREVPNGSTLLAVLPPSAGLVAALRREQSENSAVAFLDSPQGADYLLDGRVVDGHLQYAWVLPDGTEQARREQPPSARPVRSDWIAAGESATEVERAGAALTDKALRLGRIRAWLALVTPPDSLGSTFPYHLALQDTRTKRLVTSGDLKGGSAYKIMLTAGEVDLQRVKYTVTPRFVYVFGLDQFGKGSLLFPVLGHGNEGNHVPVGPNPKNQNEPVDVLSLLQNGQHLVPLSSPEVKYDFEVTAPYGVDTYLLLTSEQPIDDPDVFEFDGARSKGEGRGRATGSPLTNLLSDVGAGRRSSTANRPVPTDWALERLTLRSVE